MVCSIGHSKELSGAIEPTAIRSARPITIGFTPGQDSEDLRDRAQRLVRLLSQETGLQMQSYVGPSYGDLIDQMREKRVDFAFLSALSYVESEKVVGTKVLLKKIWVEPFYYSTLLVRADSKIRSLSGLKGSRIAFVDRWSTSGFLYPKVALSKIGLDPEDKDSFAEVVWTGNHDKSVELLEQKKVEAIAVFADDQNAKLSAWTQRKKSPKAVRSVWVSAPIPTDPFVVRSDFYEKFPKKTHEVMFALIELTQNPLHAKDIRLFLGVEGLMMATPQQYDSVLLIFESVKQTETKKGAEK